MPVANNAEGLSTDLAAAGRHLLPLASVHFHGPVAGLAGQHDDFGNHQFGDGTRIAKGAVEDGNPVAGGIGKVYLVRANTEAANYQEVFGMLENIGAEFGLGTDANYVNIPV